MNKSTGFMTANMLNRVKSAMKTDKYFVIPGAYSEQFCTIIRQQIDAIQEGIGVEINYNGTEVRVWSAQKRSVEIQQFCDHANLLISAVNGREKLAGTVLAIKNSALMDADKSSLKGRWHIDSWRSQEKVFLFLNDTTENSGPFEFIPNTNRWRFRLRKALKPGFFFSYKEILKRDGSRPYQSINDNKIEALIKDGYPTKSVVVKAGTVLIADTSYLIHRARPCIEGQRYALTAYYSVKQNFKNFDI